MARRLLLEMHSVHSHVLAAGVLAATLEVHPAPRAKARLPTIHLTPHLSLPHLPLAQLWVLAAKLEVRARRLDAARRILGMALGVAPKDKTFKAYIELELQLGNVDRWVLGFTWPWSWEHEWGWGGGCSALAAASQCP